MQLGLFVWLYFWPQLIDLLKECTSVLTIIINSDRREPAFKPCLDSIVTLVNCSFGTFKQTVQPGAPVHAAVSR